MKKRIVIDVYDETAQIVAEFGEDVPQLTTDELNLAIELLQHEAKREQVSYIYKQK